jgi:4'-phosphopantetheinyl transferase
MDIYWFEQTEADLPPDNSWLSPAELDRMSSLRIPKRRADWRLGRWTAKLACAIYLNESCNFGFLASVEVRPATSGAPELFVAGTPAGVSISITHCGGNAACAITGSSGAFGCDMELIEPRSEAFIADYFTADERDMIARAQPSEKCCVINLLWSAKESALKALREGLRLDTRSVTVRLYEPAICALEEWHLFEVAGPEDRIFVGWFSNDGRLVRTIAAERLPAPPIMLRNTEAVRRRR